MKKVLSLVLVLTLVLGSFGAAFAAVDLDDVAGEDCEDAVKTLVALGVVKGFPDGTFKPDRAITKAELASMLINVLGYADLVTEGTRSGFSDTIGHWAEPEVALAAGQQIVNGLPDGRFQPDKVVSYDEAITMIVRALGYNDTCLKGTWPTKYKIKAADLKITEDVKMRSAEADRGGVAILVNNALTCATVTVNKDGDIEKEKIGEDSDDKPIYEMLLDKVGKKEDIIVTPDTIDKDDKAYIESVVDLKQYMYETITTYQNEDDEIVYVSDTETATMEGIFKGIDEDKNEIKVKVGEKTKRIALKNVTNAAIFYNGAESDLDIERDIKKDAKIKLVFPDYKGNPDIDEPCKGIVVNDAVNTVLVEDEFDSDYPEDFNGIALPLTEDDDDNDIVDLDNLIIEGDATSLEDIEKNDIINVYSSEDDIGDEPDSLKLVVTRNSVEGKATKVKKDDKGKVEEAKIDGKYYDVGEYAINNDGGKVILGAEGTFFLDENGDIVAWTGDSVLLDDYAYVIALDTGDPSGFDKEDAPRIKMVNDEGDKVVYDFQLKKDGKTKVLDEDGEETEEECDKYKKVGDAEIVVKEDSKGEKVIAIKDIDGFDDKIVKYKVNNDNEITDIVRLDGEGRIDHSELVDAKKSAKFDDEMLNYEYDFTSKTVIINYDSSDDDYSVVDFEDLSDDVEEGNWLAAEDPDSLGSLTFVYVVNGAASADDNFAAIVEVETELDENEDPILGLTVFHNGKEVKYLTEDNTSIEETTDCLVNLRINSDNVVTDVEDATDEQVKIGTVVELTDSNRIVFEEDGVDSVKLSNECAVYVYDEEDEELKRKTAIKSIRAGDKVKVYNNVEDSKDKIYDAVLIIKYEK